MKNKNRETNKKLNKWVHPPIQFKPNLVRESEREKKCEQLQIEISVPIRFEIEMTDQQFICICVFLSRFSNLI